MSAKCLLMALVSFLAGKCQLPDWEAIDPDPGFVFAPGLQVAIFLFGGLGLRVRVSKLLGSNYNLRALTLMLR